MKVRNILATKGGRVITIPPEETVRQAVALLVSHRIGAVVVAAGTGYVKWGFADLFHGKVDGVAKVLIGLILSPLIGFGIGFLIHRVMTRVILRNAKPSANKWLRRTQWITSAGLAFSHGANDAQKSMGIITLVLVLSGQLTEFKVPFWVILACAGAITLGILSGGWRIVRTVGFGIYKVRPAHALDTPTHLSAGHPQRLRARSSRLNHSRGVFGDHGYRLL